MPWYRVPLNVYLPADDPEAAREKVLGRLCSGPDDDTRPLAEAAWPQELAPAQAYVRLRLREILRQAERDRGEGNVVSDGRYPGVRFSPQAAAELAALEFEEQQGE